MLTVIRRGAYNYVSRARRLKQTVASANALVARLLHCATQRRWRATGAPLSFQKHRA